MIKVHLPCILIRCCLHRHGYEGHGIDTAPLHLSQRHVVGVANNASDVIIEGAVFWRKMTRRPVLGIITGALD